MEFDQFANNYENVLDKTIAMSGEDSTYFAQYKARYLARVMGASFAGSILDFGCGVGLLSWFLTEHLPKSQVNGFDVSADSISKIRPDLIKQGIFTSDEKQLRHDYDLIVVANVMHHIEPADRERAVKTLAGRLNPRGILAIIEHNPVNPATRWVVENCPFDKDVTLLRPTETRAYVTSAKLSVVRQDYIVFMPSFLAWFRWVERWLGWLPLGAQYVVMGSKA